MKNISKILVPTDFSKFAHETFQFAMMISSKTGAQIDIVHFCTSLSDINHIPESIDVLVSERKVQMEEFLSKYIPVEPGKIIFEGNVIKVDHHVIIGFPGDEIPKYVRNNQVDLVVMGKRGEHDRLDRWFGTVTSTIIDSNCCPVILIPNHSNIHLVKKMLVCVDPINFGKKEIETVHTLQKTFESNLQFLHIGKETDDREQFESKIHWLIHVEGIPEMSYTVKEMEGETVDEEINDYAEHTDCDLLVMVHHKKSLWKSLFDTSNTNRLLHITKKPIFVIN